MRKKRWIASVWGMVAAAAFGQTASAQGPASPLDGPFPPVAPPPAGYAGQPTYSPVAPDAASPAGFPPQMEAWPTISPFDHAVDTTYNDNGIWFREMLNHERRYRVTAQFLSARFRQPGHATIGHAAAVANFNDVVIDGRGGGGVDPFDIYGVKDFMGFAGQGRYFNETDGSIDYPDPPGAQVGPLPRNPNFALTLRGNASMDDFIFLEPKGGLLQIVNWADDPNSSINDSDDASDDEIADTVLSPVTGQVFGDNAVTRFGGDPGVVGERLENPSSPGMRLTFGLEDEDGSGFDWSGYWVNGEATVFSRGLDDPRRPRLTNVIFFDAPHIGPGAVEYLDYNVLFRMTHETETAGTDLAFYTTPMVDFGWLRMRPMYGVRYNYIREGFNFTGRDNGFAYAYDADGDIFQESDDAEAGTSGSPVLGSNLIPNSFDDPFTFTALNPYETNVTSRVRSHLYGPQIGFDMQMGGEHLMLTAVTKAGLVANTEKLTLDTAGFGTAEALTGIRSFNSDAKTHTHISPFVEFNTAADVNVFPFIPYVNRWLLFKNARVRAGYDFLVVGHLQRPMDNIIWRADQSGGPVIRDGGRKHWYMQNWSLGIHWNY